MHEEKRQGNAPSKILLGVVAVLGVFVCLFVFVSFVSFIYHEWFLDEPPIRAASEGDDAAVKRLLDSGADIDHRGEWLGNTPVLYAIRAHKVSTIKLLIARGADINLKNDEGDSAAKIIGFWPELAADLKKP